MKHLHEYFDELIAGNELAAFWLVTIFALFWGCLLGVTGVLAVQEQIANRRRKDRI